MEMPVIAGVERLLGGGGEEGEVVAAVGEGVGSR